jgi:NAD(P)-dependent dehydrogenase (short-subunit alcohol dehydrogenase family)
MMNSSDFDRNSYKADAQLLKDKIILVTGAGDGIGKVAAETYARYGATLILLGKTTGKLENTYDAIEKAGGALPAIYPMNLQGATPKDYQELAAVITKEFGRLDGILHNASFLGDLCPIENQDIETWYKVQQVNINAGFMLTQVCLPLLKSAKTASIIFTSSAVGRKGRAYWGAYAVSKFATEGLMQVLADELETNTAVRSNSINPGATRTAMRATAYPAEDATALKTPEEIMPLYLYLMGDDSSSVNGQSLDAQ